MTLSLDQLRNGLDLEKDRVLSQQPNNADAVQGLAETYQAAGDFRRAEEQYKRAIALRPSYWSGYNKLGAFYYTQSRYRDAAAQFQH